MLTRNQAVPSANQEKGSRLIMQAMVRWGSRVVCGMMFLAFLVSSTKTLTPGDPASNRARLQASYSHLPLGFEANQGQTDSEVRFVSRGRGYTLFLTSTEAVLVLKGREALGVRREAKEAPVSPDSTGLSRRTSVLSPSPFAKPRGIPQSLGNGGQPSALATATALRMRLVGANESPLVEGLEELPGKSHYFIGNNPDKWRTNIPTYAKVTYQNVYPGVDLVYYGNQRQLEYDFIVAPGADPNLIALGFDDTERAEIDEEGDLVLRIAGGEIRLRKPLVYQEINGARQAISGRYALRSLSTDNSAVSTRSEVSFQVATYDTRKPLTIDPVLVYSTYLGGSGADEGRGIALDSSGNAYVTGSTTSSNFPTASPFQGASAAGTDAFVTKLSSDGSALVFSTYLGGSLNDEGRAIAVDLSGNAYLTGITNSTDFPTASPLQGNRGGNDAFVTKLNSTGSALVYSTYLGGNGEDRGLGIAVDIFNSAYVTGGTNSTNFPTANPLQAVGGGATLDAFVTKLNAAGSALVFSTYLGGSGTDEGRAILVDGTPNVHVTGVTSSSNFPTAAPFQPAFGGGATDAFVARINPPGTSFTYSTYLGGSGTDEGRGLASDLSANTYVTGSTASPNFPTANALQAASGGGTDVFVTKLNNVGSTLVYSTYLGGSGTDEGFGIAVDSSRNAYVTGETASTNFPTADPIQAFFGGGTRDGFVANLNAAGSTLLYSTYGGGSGGDEGRAIAVDTAGNAFVTGRTDSPNFPIANPFQPALGGGTGDAFVAKLSPVAVFALTVTVTVTGSASGTVSSSPQPGINCGTDCSEPYAVGTVVTLVPTAASGSTFAGWSGACAGTGLTPCTLTMNANMAANATFSPAPAAGDGGGGGGGCFIATAAFGSPLAAEVQVLRAFRDRSLVTHTPGRLFVAAYYQVSPPLARLIGGHETLRSATRTALRLVVWWAGWALESPVLAWSILVLAVGGLVVGMTTPFILFRAQRPHLNSRGNQEGRPEL